MSKYLIKPRDNKEFFVEANYYEDMVGRVVEMLNMGEISLADVVGAKAFIQCAGDFMNDIQGEIDSQIEEAEDCDECGRGFDECDNDCGDACAVVDEETTTIDCGAFTVTITPKEIN